MKNFHWRGMVRVRWTVLEFYTHVISPQRLTLETSNFVHGSATWSLSLVMSVSLWWVFPKWAWSGSREQLLHCGLRKFRHSKLSVYRWYPQLNRGRFVYDTYKTMEATRSRHGWVHMFITHRPTVTLQLHNFDLFRICRTSTFCTVAWQLARFQLTPASVDTRRVELMHTQHNCRMPVWRGSFKTDQNTMITNLLNVSICVVFAVQ